MPEYKYRIQKIKYRVYKIATISTTKHAFYTKDSDQGPSW